MRTLSILLLLLATPAAHADDKDVARQAYIEGTRYYDLNDFARALDAFKRAYLHFDEPVLLYNIAQCHRQLGDKNEALKFYRSYLRKSPNAPNKDEVKRLIAGLEATVAQEQKTRTSPPQGLEEPRPPALEGPAVPPPAVEPPKPAAQAPKPAAQAPKPDPKLAMLELQRKQQEEKARKEKDEVEARKKIEEKKEQEKREAKQRAAEEREAKKREEAQKREERRFLDEQQRGEGTPLVKKWWLWTAVAGVVVVGVGLGVGLGLGLRGDSFSPTLRGVGPGMQALEF